MATRHPQWSDEYWLLLMQLYLRKPVGVKAIYSRPMVNLALDLHIPPQYLYEQMFRLRTIDTPRMEKLWTDYGNNPRRLSRGVKLLRQKLGYNDLFFEGVDVNETWERDFKAIDEQPFPHVQLTPVMLIVILDLYFRLTPLTMVADTPEIVELARLLKMKPQQVVEVMEVFQFCDPCLKRHDFLRSPLLGPCQQIWQRFGNGSPQKLAALAAQLKEFF